ncbi:hypothetical protein HDU90_005006 [Geranomyces variabilis]|nr:hypothetical protein HDU90_005006 [Geranomyces variabilis]
MTGKNLSMKTIVRLDPTTRAATLASVPEDSSIAGTTQDLKEFPNSWASALGILGVIVSPMQFLHIPAVIEDRKDRFWPLCVIGLQLLEFGFEYDSEARIMCRGQLQLYVMEKGLHYHGRFTTEALPDNRSHFLLHKTLVIS